MNDELRVNNAHHIWEYCTAKLQMRGWPVKFISHEEVGVVSRVQGQWVKEGDGTFSDETAAKIVDACVALVILFVLFYIWERLIQSHGARK